MSRSTRPPSSDARRRRARHRPASGRGEPVDAEFLSALVAADGRLSGTRRPDDVVVARRRRRRRRPRTSTATRRPSATARSTERASTSAVLRRSATRRARLAGHAAGGDRRCSRPARLDRRSALSAARSRQLAVAAAALGRGRFDLDCPRPGSPRRGDRAGAADQRHAARSGCAASATSPSTPPTCCAPRSPACGSSSRS